MRNSIQTVRVEEQRMVVQSLELVRTVDGIALSKTMLDAEKLKGNNSLSDAKDCSTWISDPDSTLFALSNNTSLLAIARSTALCIVDITPQLSGEANMFSINGCPVGEVATSLLWLDNNHLIIGYSNGVVKLYGNR